MLMDTQFQPKYYFITVFERLDINKYGFPAYDAARCWGFYTDKQIAIKALHENWTDMEEGIYKYAVIEEYREGISGMTGYRQFFKFDDEREGYFEIDEPEGYEHFAGFALG